MNSQLVKQLIDQLGFNLGANGLPYEMPIHPQLVHFTGSPVLNVIDITYIESFLGFSAGGQ